MCNKINRIIMGLTAWIKKCIVSIQVWIKCVSMEGNVVRFFWGKECAGAPQRPLGFTTALNMWDLAQVLVEWFYDKACLRFGQTQWRKGGEAWSLGTRRSCVAMVGKTHFLSFILCSVASIKLVSIHTGRLTIAEGENLFYCGDLLVKLRRPRRFP